MKHLVQFSTGAASAEVAWRVVQAHGTADVVLLSADTLVEDEDNWRFAAEVVSLLGDVEWVRLADGRTPMQVGRDHRAVPSNRMAICSRILKRELLRKHMDEHYDPADSVVYLGFDWTEGHRLAASVAPWRPWTVSAPLMSPPYLWKDDILRNWRARGIEPPRLYALGFGHANCGGACVRGVQAQWSLLLQVNPARYGQWEAEEEETRQLIGKDVSILRDRVGGPVRPLTLRAFRERLERQPSMFDAEDLGACGCFMPDVPETTDDDTQEAA